MIVGPSIYNSNKLALLEHLLHAQVLFIPRHPIFQQLPVLLLLPHFTDEGTEADRVLAPHHKAGEYCTRIDTKVFTSRVIILLPSPHENSPRCSPGNLKGRK